MLNLYTEIEVQVTEKIAGLTENYWYRVIGTYHRSMDKEGKQIDQDLFCVIDDNQKVINIFPSKCKIRRV